ncbi:MAG: carboxypeptidase regulatory-like domain-containing protein [Nitrospirae bacterium]|nr:carboxypeptidase regulatory-like domain-containing protein [Nitrospirota bacterium]
MNRDFLCAPVRYSFFALLLIAVVHVIFPGVSALYAEDKAVIKGKVADVEGKAVEGAMVFVYASPEVRRSADFISAPTGRDGLFRLSVLPGKYWVVARLKKADGFGPLMPGDKHSGEPKEIEALPGGEVDMQIIVTDLKEAVIMHAKEREGPARLRGRIIDDQGAPVTGVYAIANRNEKLSGIPNYVSAWVDKDGRYTLFIPRGTYYIGSAIIFPPGNDFVIDKKVTVDTGNTDMDILRRIGDGR